MDGCNILIDKSTIFDTLFNGFSLNMKIKQEISNIFRAKYPQAFDGHVIDAKYFFFEADATDNREIEVVFGGYEKCAPDFEIERTTYPYYVIECAIKGQCSLSINKKTHTLKRGIVAGFCPGTPHHYICDKHDPLEHIFVAFRGSKAAELMKISNISQKGALEPADTECAIELIEALLRNGIIKTEYSQELCHSYLRCLLLEQACHFDGSDCKQTLSETTYQRCKKFIDENFSNILFISKAADECGIDIRYMSSLFKKHGHITPHQYLMRLKMNKAAILLLTSNLSIKRLAETVGFQDPYHFSRNFKKVHGVSPYYYRQSHMTQIAYR